MPETGVPDPPWPRRPRAYLLTRNAAVQGGSQAEEIRRKDRKTGQNDEPRPFGKTRPERSLGRTPDRSDLAGQVRANELFRRTVPFPTGAPLPNLSLKLKLRDGVSYRCLILVNFESAVVLAVYHVVRL